MVKTLVFVGGAATGLGVHEMGHVAFGAALHAHPRAKRISYGPIPFFAIDHDYIGRRQEFVISSAGLWTQQAYAEAILTARPFLRTDDAPFLKGALAFHLGTSIVYSVAALGKLGPPERDTRGMASSFGRAGVPEPAIAPLILAPAVLDAYRYQHPSSTWARWASRGAKVLGVVLAAR